MQHRLPGLSNATDTGPNNGTCLRFYGIRIPLSSDGVQILDNAERTEEKLPLEKLMQPEAILYYDRIVLYEGMRISSSPALLPSCDSFSGGGVDDVRDLGEIYLEVKIVSTASLVLSDGQVESHGLVAAASHVVWVPVAVSLLQPS